MRHQSRNVARFARESAMLRRPDITPKPEPRMLTVSLGSFMRQAIDSARKGHNARIEDNPRAAMLHRRDRQDVASADMLSRMVRNATR